MNIRIPKASPASRGVVSRTAMGAALFATLLALGGCGLIVKPASNAAAAADVEPPPPESDTATEQPPVNWQGLGNEQAVEQQEPVVPAPPVKPKGVWQRMRAEFALPDIQNDRVARELHWYATHDAYMLRVAQRAQPYLYYIVSQLEARDMPTDLALLPVVESAYDPFAYSKGRAAGLWQFIPSTGRRFNLRQNWWYDGRRDVAASTRAALDYLQYLHDMFDGNWLLALAAYNSGSGTVRSAIARNERRHKPTDFWDLDLPAETRAYVPRLLAVRNLIADPQKYGLALPTIPNKPYLARVPIEGQLDIARASKMADLTVKQMYLLNPGFNRWATEPNKTQALFVPIDQQANFVTQLAMLPEGDRVEWLRHKIARGETLSEIASHYGTTTGTLEQVNHLDGTLIRAGHYLMVPNAATDFDQHALVAITHLRHDELARKARKLVHVVRAGDSLWRVSRHFGVTVHQLASWNHIKPAATLHLGQKLVVWRHGGPATALVRTVSATASDMLRKVHYTVHSGDSLYSIANRFNVDIGQLTTWNTLSVDDYLQPGQRLVLYVDVRNQSTQS